MNRKLKIGYVLILIFAMSAQSVEAQRVLTLQECRQMALDGNRDIKISEEKVRMADYDRRIARANYFPKLSASGTYMYNSREFQLASDDQLSRLENAGTLAAQGVGNDITQIIRDNISSQWLQEAVISSSWFQEMIQQLPNAGVFQSLNTVGAEVADALVLGTRNVAAGIISIEEPLYVGGKINAYNKVAVYAKELAQTQLTTDQQEVIVTTDQAYWQIVSLANKLKLTENYVELLRTMSSNIDKLVAEGMATNSDKLSIKVKLNEAELTLIKVQNGLALSKMLLCQQCGLPLDSDITLADETLDDVEVPTFHNEYTEDFVMEHRPELQSLTLATRIYDKKVTIARSEFLPTVAVVGNYVITNPSCFNGFQNKFGGFFNVGVVAKIPIYHFGEGMNKVRKAKSEAEITRLKLEDTKHLVMLQVSQYESKVKEAESRLMLTTGKLSDAEENLRMATLGFDEGVVPSSTLNAAQTAWLQAHSDLIDAKIDVIMANTYLKKATGNID